MKKNLLMMSAAIAAMILFSCSNELENDNPNLVDNNIAYMSIQVETQRGTRAGSTEDNGIAESTLNTFYLITFDAVGNVVVNPEGNNKGYIELPYNSATDLKLKPVKVSGASKNLVLVANPGTELKKAIFALTSGSTYATFNKAIVNVTTTEMMDTSNGFTMITSGVSDKEMNLNDQILNPYVEIGNKIQIVTSPSQENTAKQEAEKDENRLKVKLERLATKLKVAPAATIESKKDPNAKVTLTAWTVDVLNTTFFPFAEKTLISDAHTGSSYKFNFYTKDPNFTSDPGTGYATGLAYATVDDVVTYDPVLPFNNYYGWKKQFDTDIAYTIENTMASPDQKIANSTRIIMKATYFPGGFDLGKDWFHWAGTDYKTLADLITAYTDPNASTELKQACEQFLAKVKAFNSTDITVDNFANLTQEMLDKITKNGGQIVKDGKNPVIRWYQKGVCYYSYEIRHDNTITGNMAFGKYGVVRNNWYNLTLKSVKEPGTPWYPEAKKPGPNDPEPFDPNDTQEGYLGVTVEKAPWFVWATDIEDVD